MSNSDPQHPSPSAETDDRFPSGPWTGYYVQQGQRGQQDLILNFRDGEAEGSGSDAGGDFLVQGRYDADRARCTLTKTYPGSHEVEYEGAADDSGIWGTWLLYSMFGQVGIPADRGTFHIWPTAKGNQHAERAEAHAPIDHARVS